MYFNYHAKLQSLIKTGHSTAYEFLDEYRGICPCLLVYFDNHKPMPIRVHKFEEYMFILSRYGVEEKKKDG